MGPRTLLTGIAVGRIAFGAAMMVAPAKAVGEGWIGDEAKRPAAGVMVRAVGARDVALGLATLAALRNGSPLKPLIVAASLADATDFVATFAAGQAIPPQGRVAVGLAAGAALVGQAGLLRTVES